MNDGFKYRLEPYSGMKSRFDCPQCGSKKNFVRYVDLLGNYVGDDVGRCNSENSCGYHKKPDGNAIVQGGFRSDIKAPDFLPLFMVDKPNYNDILFSFLAQYYYEDDVRAVYDKYEVCSNNAKWKYSTAFYQKDIDGNYRTAKIILYGNDGKRIKYPYSHINWLHRDIDNFTLSQCLFGEHLLVNHDRKKEVYLVESEKTAIICALENPKDLFLATGGMSNINREKLGVLSGFKVSAIPDKGAYKYWHQKLEPLGISVNRFVEDSDAESGQDCADLILKTKKKL